MPAKLTGQCVTRSAMSQGPGPGTWPGLPGTVTVPLELVEVAERRPAGAHARRVRRELLVGDLAERALDAEVRDVQILLVDDRRDARVDLDHVLADELDVEEVLDLERRDDPLGELHQRVVVERDEVHREAGAHRLARLRVAEHDAAPVGDAVDRPLAALGELHHEQLRLVVAEQLDELLEAQRLRDARAVREQLLVPVRAGGQDPEAARARREDRLHGDVALRVAELARRRRDGGAAARAAEVGRRHAEAAQQRVRLGLVVRPPHGLGRRDEHRNRKRLARGGERGQVVRRLRQHDVDALALDELEQRRRRTTDRPTAATSAKRVAEVPPDRALAHVDADDAAPRARRSRAARARAPPCPASPAP